MERIQEILIKGSSGVGKSLYADALRRSAKRAGLRVEFSDHHLSTSHVRFSKDLEQTRRSHNEAQADLSIIVINDGGRDLQVSFTNGIRHDLAQILFQGE